MSLVFILCMLNIEEKLLSKGLWNARQDAFFAGLVYASKVKLPSQVV